MKRAAIWTTVLVASIAGWTVIASYLFVSMAGISGLLERPWLAWWLYVANSPDAWTVMLLVASGAVPLVLAAGIAYRFRMFFGVRPPGLYGNSKWATERDMADSGIVTSRKPL